MGRGGEPPGGRPSSRRRLLQLLTESGRPLDVVELGELTGLHANTLRGHLQLLVEMGQVHRSVEERTTPGRPRVLYSLPAQRAADSPYRQLATELAMGLAVGGDATEAGQAAGRHWAQQLRAARQGDGDGVFPADEAVDVAASGLDALGFHAETDPLRDRLYLTHCPFKDLARENRSVCKVHHDLLTGLFDELGGQVEVSRLDVFVRPDLCVAHLRRTPPATATDPAPDPEGTSDER